MRLALLVLAALLLAAPPAVASHSLCGTNPGMTFGIVPGTVYFQFWFHEFPPEGDGGFWLESNGVPGLQISDEDCDGWPQATDTRLT